MLKTLLSTVNNSIKNKNLHCFFRNFASLHKEFDVSQFCTVIINCPYNININPIDVFKNQEQIFVNIDSNEQSIPDIQFKQDGDTVSIEGPSLNGNGNCTLNVDASVKANLSVFGGNNDITVGSFYGKFIDVKSDEGNINLSKSQCEEITLISNGGNINCKDVIQAADILLETKNSGKITTDRLQGLKLKTITTDGAINIGSSYCDKSHFETNSGELTLKNLHKNVSIKVNNEALINIVGFDGELKAHFKKGLADIQIAKLYNISEIIFDDPSTLILRLSEECQIENLIDISTNNYVLSDTLQMDCYQRKDSCTLSPLSVKEILGKLAVKCENSSVLVDSASWSELFKASMKKRK